MFIAVADFEQPIAHSVQIAQQLVILRKAKIEGVANAKQWCSDI